MENQDNLQKQALLRKQIAALRWDISIVSNPKVKELKSRMLDEHIKELDKISGLHDPYCRR